jgi:hypothetical protein
MTRAQARQSDPSAVLSIHHRRIMADAPLSSAVERALVRYVETRATRPPGRVTLARVTSSARVSA